MTRSSPGSVRNRSGGLRAAVILTGAVMLIAGVSLTIAGPALYRAGVLDLAVAREGLQQMAMFTLLAAAGVGTLAFLLAIAGRAHRAGILAVLLVIAGGMSGGGLYSQQVSLRALPPINDAQTDWTQPVAFTEATLRARAAAGAVRVRDDAVVVEGNGRWSGMTFAAAQAEVYRDIVPLLTEKPVADVVAVAAAAARRLGFRVTQSDPRAGVVEAVHDTGWYGLVYDVAVRVRREDRGARVDVRSTSRLAGHDLGENAALIKQLTDEIALQLQLSAP